MVRKNKPAKPTRRKPVTRRTIRLPQGCSPSAKLAALDVLADMEGIKPIDDPSTMVAPFWPKEESADSIVEAVRALRRQGK